MKRLLLYRPAAQRELNHMDRADAARIMRALEAFAATGQGDVKALKGALKGRFTATPSGTPSKMSSGARHRSGAATRN